MKATIHLGCRTAFDFDGPQFPAGQGEDKIDLSPIGRAIVVRLGSIRRNGNQRFGDEAFPCLPNDGITEQRFFISHAKERVRERQGRIEAWIVTDTGFRTIRKRLTSSRTRIT
jgi:hypothetical protein